MRRPWQIVHRGCGVFALASLLGAGAMQLSAQSYLQNIGVPTFTTKLPVENGFINAANGNLHLEIPLGSFPQRAGAPDKIVLMYDSAIWSPASGTWQPTNVASTINDGSFGGWRIVTSRDAGFFSYGETDSGYCSQTDNYYWATYSPWIWVAPDGTQHSFQDSSGNAVTTLGPIDPADCGYSGNGIPNASGYASDGSGFFISITNFTTATVYAPDGTKIYSCNYMYNCPGGPYATEDPNGNYTLPITYTYGDGGYTSTATYVDTLGRSVLTQQTNSSGTVYTFSIPNSQGGTSTYTVNLEQINVSTNFGQSGISEYAGTIWVISEIDLPDGTKYLFNYDYGTSPGSYGLLSSMTLPTGGQISYSFANFIDAYQNTARGISGRTTPDGPWMYATQMEDVCSSNQVGCQQRFTVTKPSGDLIIYEFLLNGGPWPFGEFHYNGSSGPPISSIIQCFSFMPMTGNGLYPNCPYGTTTAAPSTNAHLIATTTGLLAPAGNIVYATTKYSWDHSGQTNQGIYNEVTQIQEWNFGSSTANAPDRTTAIGYVSDSNPGYVAANILDRPTSVTISGGAQTLYCYDSSPTYCGTPASPGSMTGLPGHDDNYGTNYITRGNVTLVRQLVGGSTYLNSSATYDMTGQPLTSTDPNGAQTTLNYGCANGYPTGITVPLLANPIQLGFDCNTGLLTSIADPNTQSTSFSYDNMGRPLTAGYPDGGQTGLTYNYSGSTFTGSTATQKITSSQNLVTINNTDGLGRVTSSVTTSDPDGPTTVSTVYDLNGRVLKVSNPYRSTSDPTYGFEKNSGYDGLDRVTQITHADGHVSSIYYGTAVTSPGGLGSQLCAASTYGVGYPILTIDEAGNKLQSWIDAFGRIIEADEPTATSNSLTANTCYSYDLNNNLTGVLAALGGQTRSYVYDMASRLTSKSDPESGTATYTWDSDSSMCGLGAYTSNGDVVKTIDADGHCINWKYDALHRLTDVGSSTGCQRFRYDSTSGILGSLPSGLSISNPFGHLVEAETDTCAWPVTQSSIVTDQWSSYDPMGRVKLNTQCTVAYQNCGTTSYSALNYGYDLLGDMTSYTNGAGVTLTQPFNGAGRLTSVTSSLSDSNHPGTLFSNVHYNALGEMSLATLGNGAVESFGYAPRGWPLTATVSSESTGTPGKGTVTINPINGSDQSSTQNGYSSSQGANPANTFADDGGGSLGWEIIGSYASSASTYSVDVNTDYLDVTNLGFNIPANATINGVYVDVNADSQDGNNNDDSVMGVAVIQLIQGGVAQGNNYACSPYCTAWNNANTNPSDNYYGSPTDTWGLSLSGNDVNASNFGLRIQAWSGTGSSGDWVYGEVNSVQITVYYTVPSVTTYDSGTVSATINSQTASVSYGNGSTSSSVASQLASSISGLGIVSASASGNVITITSTTNGASTNYSLSASSQSDNPGLFNPPSFTTSPSGSNLTGGTGAPGTLYSFSLGYGTGNSNVTSANDSVNGNWVFTYDYLNRLSTSNQNNNQNACSYGYDPLGNRTSQTATAGSCGGNLTLSYAGHNNRMDGYSYDAAGNLLGDGLHTYAYDAENRLISVDGGNTASYVYDAEGRRVQKTAGTQAEYLYDLGGNIVAELNSSGSWNRGEIFANGQHLATYNNGTTYFDHADWLGTERARSNMSDADCEAITNLPFGDGQSTTGSCTDASPLHFTGQQRDGESNLDYFPARRYSSQFGRFMSPDPTGIFLGNLNDPQSLNLYAYVRNNPTSLTDPLGLDIGGGDCGDDPTCGGCDFCFDPCEFVDCGGGGGGGGRGPQPPIYTPPDVGTSPNPPNGTLTSDDPFGGETNGIPNGLGIPYSLPGLLMPGNPGCEFGPCAMGLQSNPNALPVSPYTIQVWVIELLGMLQTQQADLVAQAHPMIGRGIKGIHSGPLACSPYLDGTGAGAIAFRICESYTPNGGWGRCVREMLLNQYAQKPNPVQLGIYLADHFYDFAVCSPNIGKP